MYDRLCNTAFNLSGLLSLQSGFTISFYKYCVTEKFYCSLPHGTYANRNCSIGLLLNILNTQKQNWMDKSCIRFKKMEQISYKLTGKLAGRLTPNESIKIYGAIIKR